MMATIVALTMRLYSDECKSTLITAANEVYAVNNKWHDECLCVQELATRVCLT